MTGDKILKCIIEKGGLPGACANLWKQDKAKSRQFIKECYAMSHTPLARNLWGDDLIKAIARYTGKGLLIAEAKLTGFDLMVAHTVKTIRIKGGYKQSVMAQALGLSQGYYCKMEKGIKPITIGQFDIIARQLNVSVTEILQISYNKA